MNSRNEGTTVMQGLPARPPGEQSSRLTLAERETTLQFSDLDGTIRIFSAQPAFLARLRRHPLARLTETHRSENGKISGQEFELPLACLSIALSPRKSVWAGMLQRGRGGAKQRLSGFRRAPGRIQGVQPLRMRPDGVHEGQTGHPGRLSEGHRDWEGVPA